MKKNFFSFLDKYGKKILYGLFYFLTFILGLFLGQKGLKIDSGWITALATIVYTALTAGILVIAVMAKDAWLEERKYDEKREILLELINFFDDFFVCFMRLYGTRDATDHKILLESFDNYCKNMFEEKKYQHFIKMKNAAKRFDYEIPNADYFLSSIVSKGFLINIVEKIKKIDEIQNPVRSIIEEREKLIEELRTSINREEFMEAVSKINQASRYCNDNLKFLLK